MTERLRHEYMASHGIVSIALDFRSGNEDPYPASVQDINYAVRWAKANARSLKTRPELIGLSGQSSGGHLAMLVAMRPHDPRYTAIALPAGTPPQDASVRCVDHVLAGDQPAQPLSPCQARAWRAATNGARPSFRAMTPYWRIEANMAEGNPMMALERGEKLILPPAIWFQGRERHRSTITKMSEFGFPRQRAAALLRQLQEGRRRYRAGIYRHGSQRQATRPT